MKVFASEGPASTWDYIATKQGFFTDQGIAVEHVANNVSGLNAEAALQGGSLTFSQIGTLTYLRAMQKGTSMRAVAVLDQGMVLFYAFSGQLAKAKNITPTSPADQVAGALKGSKLAISAPGGSTDVITRVFLGQRKINPDSDLTLVPVGGTGMMPALQ
ncbi:MAG: ABC transporter substrate-binding protein, partial [Chloroflexi bacterium]|nr:ABC transporter substrate-binding protein [Chloroflexota bacterium]